MLQFLLCTFLLLLSSSHSANVLVIAGLRGSHLYFSTDIARKLVQFGHNVTLVTMYSDNREGAQNADFKFVTFGDDSRPGPDSKYWDAVLKHSIDQPSQDMYQSPSSVAQMWRRSCGGEVITAAWQ